MPRKPKVYIAGPYSKRDVIVNIRFAIESANTLFEYGFIPFIPHLTGFWHLVFPHDYETWMEYDKEWLLSCDVVYRMEGESPEADREVNDAIQLGIPVFFEHNHVDLIHWLQTWQKENK